MKKLITCLIAFIITFSTIFQGVCLHAYAKVNNINEYAEKASEHCAEASLACAQAQKLGYNYGGDSKKGTALYWACWAFVAGGKNMPSDNNFLREISSPNVSKICSEIDSGNPVLCYFDHYSWDEKKQKWVPHWVVAWDYDSSNIIVMCPYSNGVDLKLKLSKSEFSSSSSKQLARATVLKTNFVQNVISDKLVIADGVFQNVNSTRNGDDATIGFNLRSVGSDGHDLYDLGFILSADKNMSQNVVKHYESEKASRTNDMFLNVLGSSYGMKKWCGGINSSATYWYQFFIVKNGIEIKTLPRKLGTDEVNTSYTGSTTVIHPSSITLNKTSTTLNKGESETLTATVVPSNATNKAVTWSSDKTSVATVSNGKVTAVGVGTANITVKTADGGKTATCKVTVTQSQSSEVIDDSKFQSGDSGVYHKNVTQTNAEIGFVVSNTVSVQNCGFQIGTKSDLSDKKTVKEQSQDFSPQQIQAGGGAGYKLNDRGITLSPGTKYYYRVFIKISGVTYYSSIKNFTTTGTATDTTAPTITWYKIYDADSTGFTVVVTATDNVGVTKVAFPVWTEKDGQDDLKSDWPNSTAVSKPGSDGAWYYRVKYSEHNNETGKYNIHVYPYDKAGNYSCKIIEYDASVAVDSVSLNKTSLDLIKGNSETLVATVAPAHASNKAVIWSSSNTNVATVDTNGKVTAVGNGNATIYVTTVDGNKFATCSVRGIVLVTGVSINTPATTSIKKGTSLTLTTTVSPSDATNPTVVWSSGNPSVATVDANGKVTGVAPGTATITVTTNDGLKTDSIDIEVYWYGNINIDYLWDGQENTAIELDASGRVVSAPITPDRTGYILEGWYKEKTFAHKVDFAKDILAKDSAVYAKWAPITYTVKYDSNCNGSGKMTDLKCSYDQKYTLAANAYTNPHNIFIGWNTQADGNGKSFENKASIENLTTKDGDVITLFAQWESTYCTVTFDYLDGVHPAVTQKVDRGGLVIAPEVFDRADYVFDGWYSDSSFKTPFNPATGTIEGDTTLYAHWIPSSDDYGDLSEEEIEEIIEGGKTGDDIPNNLWVSGVTDKQYTGKEITQSFKVYDHKTLLKSGKDYTVKYTNNKKIGTATITIKGKGNYSGTVTETFQILPADISETTNSVVFDKTMFKAYTGGVQNPVPSLTVNGKKLTNKKDYIVTYPSSGEDAYVAPGLYVVRLTGTGNYTGYVDIAMTIGDQGRVSVSKLTIGSISAQTYTGSEITPAVSVKNGKKKLTENVDYEVSYSNNINVGTATVKITGKGNFFGEKTATFKIKGTAIADAVRVSLSQSTFTYDKSEHIPGVTVTAKKTGATLIKGVDYEVSYSNTVNAGKATVTITGKGSYSGTVKKTYTIAAYNISSDPDSLMTLKVTDNVTMMKGGAKPGVKLTYDGKDLVEGKDYKLTYSNNTSVGGKNKPAVTIKGCGNFAGTITKNYVIEQQSIYSLSISVKDVQYSPKAGKYKSVPTITDLNGKALKSGTDYNNVKYTYENETILPDGTTRLAGDIVGSKDILPVGTVVRVSATGKGNYAGTISTTYRIVKCSIANAKITVKNQEYTGKAVIPDKEDIVVKVNGVTLSSDEFEIISCSNNVNKGSKAKVTIRGLNAYGGVKSRTFTIKSKVFKWWWE